MRSIFIGKHKFSTDSTAMPRSSVWRNPYDSAMVLTSPPTRRERRSRANREPAYDRDRPHRSARRGHPADARAGMRRGDVQTRNQGATDPARRSNQRSRGYFQTLRHRWRGQHHCRGNDLCRSRTPAPEPAAGALQRRGRPGEYGHKLTAASGPISLRRAGPVLLRHRHARRHRHDPLGWKAHRNRGANANLASQVQ